MNKHLVQRVDPVRSGRLGDQTVKVLPGPEAGAGLGALAMASFA